MKTSIEIVIIFVVIGGLFFGVWAGLDSNIKCRIIYGKNIYNFYEMMEVISANPEKSDFGKAMQLCRDMEDALKKDSCFEYVAQVVSFCDKEKVRKACEEIKAFDSVHNKENCYNMVKKCG
jgi:hypothetical protein